MPMMMQMFMLLFQFHNGVIFSAGDTMQRSDIPANRQSRSVDPYRHSMELDVSDILRTIRDDKSEINSTSDITTSSSDIITSARVMLELFRKLQQGTSLKEVIELGEHHTANELTNDKTETSNITSASPSAYHVSSLTTTNTVRSIPAGSECNSIIMIRY